MVLVTIKSACCGVSTTESVLFVRFASNWSQCLTDACEVAGIGLVIFETFVDVRDVQFVTPRRPQTLLLLVKLPVPVLEMNDRPAGSTSERDTFVARFGPELVAVTV